jgi:hypothetical protein
MKDFKHMRISAFPRLAGFGVLLAAAISVVACTGGNKPEPFVAIATPAPASGSVTSSTSSTVALPSLSLSGIGVSGTLPTTNVAASISETLSISAPTGVTPFAKRRDTATPAPTPFIYIELATSATVMLNGVPAFVFTLPSVVAGDSYYLAGSTNGTSWFSPVSGPATVSGTTVTFAAVTQQSIQITAGQPVYIALFAVPTGSLATPTPLPSPTPVASPASVTLTAGGSAATFGVSETNDTAAFTATISCTPNPAVPSPLPTSNVFVAQVTASATPAAGGVATFTVTPGNETGACTITVTDANNASISVPVTVNTTGAIIYGKSRN